MEKVEVNGKEYVIREITYLEAMGMSKYEDLLIKSKEILKLASGITEEELIKVSLRDGLKLQKAVDKINNISDFQKPVESNKN